MQWTLQTGKLREGSHVVRMCVYLFAPLVVDAFPRNYDWKGPNNNLSDFEGSLGSASESSDFMALYKLVYHFYFNFKLKPDTEIFHGLYLSPYIYTSVEILAVFRVIIT